MSRLISRFAHRAGRCVAAVVLSACLWDGAPFAHAQTPGGVGLYKDGQLVEELVPRSALSAESAAAAAARDPQAFMQLVAGELAAEAVGGELRPETVARHAALREAAAPLAALHRAVQARRAAAVLSRSAATDDLQKNAAGLPAALATVRRVWTEVDAQIKRAGLPAEIAERHARSLAELEQRYTELQEALAAEANGDGAALDRIETLLGQLSGPVPDLTKRGPTIRREVVSAPRLTRAEADAALAKVVAVAARDEVASSAPPVSADLASTPEVQLTPEIAAQAAALGNSPVAIYEFVRNQVGFQPYLGARKGAVETLRQRAGNDTDQASLLLALLRSAGIPSRYVRGSVELTPARAAAWLGVDDAATAGAMLTTAGLDGVNVADGSNVVAVRCTRVWVEAYVPYAQYRGTAGTSLGSAWVPLDPAFAGTVLTPGQDVLTPMGFNTDAFLTDYLSTFHPLSPVEKFAADVQAYLDANQPGVTVEQIERRTATAPQSLGLLPASLPYQVLAVTGRFSELEDAKRFKVRFHLYDGATTFIDRTLKLTELAGHRLTIDYVGATPADQATIDSFGGVYQTPPNLVNVKPRLKLDGTVVVASTAAIGLARTHSSDMQFLQPAGASNAKPLVQNSLIAGNSQAIAFDTFLDTRESVLFPSSVPSPGFLETLLHDTAAEYLSTVDRGLERTGRIMRVNTTQDVSEAIVESAVRVLYSFGVPTTFEWTGLIVDADRRIVGTFPVDGAVAKEIPYMKLTGYDSSVMENRVFEDLYGQRAVSTIKLIELSRDAGLPVFTITTSIAANAPGLNQDASVVSAINAALAQGHHVIIPREAITVGGWTGTGYIDLDPATGAAGYIISGGISGNTVASGGATVDVWPIDLGCSPIGAVTGTITSSGFASGDKLCADNGKITYSVRLSYDCKDSSGNVVHRTFGPTSHTVPKTKFQIVEIYGAGVYTIMIDDTLVAPVTFTLVDVDSLKPDKGVEFDDQDNDPNTKSYAVPVSLTAGSLVTVTAKSNPVLAEASLPACWTLTGGTGSGKLSRTFSQTAPGTTVLTASSGQRQKKATLLVYKVTLSDVWEKNAVCNRVPNPKQSPANTLIVATEGSGKFELIVKGAIQPASAIGKVLCAAYVGGTHLASKPFAATGEADLAFPATGNTANYSIKVGYDANGNNQLDTDEFCPVPTEFPVIGLSSAEYNSQRSSLGTYAVASHLPYPVGATLLYTFINSTSRPIPFSSSPGGNPINCFAETRLTHNAGETFAAGGGGTITEHIWDATTSAAERVATSTELAAIVNSILAANKSTAAAFFAGNPTQTTNTFVWSRSNVGVDFAETSRLALQEYDLHVAFGHAALPTVTVEVVVNKSGTGVLSLGSVVLSGRLVDLYDFNYGDGGLARQAAIVQIGWDPSVSGRDAGRIFLERVDFAKTFPAGTFNF